MMVDMVADKIRDSAEKILLVEDERDLLWMLSSKLESEGFRVLKSSSAEEGLKLARAHRPDLIVLDIVLPRMDGVELIQILRRETQVPILFLTAKNSEIDRLLGFRLGADDYVTKPFSLEEVSARVKAILRRAAPRSGRLWKGPAVMGELEVDLERHDVRVRGRPVLLAPKEFEILKVLVEANGAVVSRSDFLEKIWHYDPSMDISTRSIDQHIAQIRRKLKSEGDRVATVKNYGYKLRPDPAP